jgi:uncharacterized protein YegJ (DUF2314 family)
MQDNVGRICADCIKERLNKWQSENEHTVIEPHGFIKIGFDFEENGKENMEHMWVHVDQVRGDTIFGRLWNDPIKAKHLKFKAAVVCKRSQIQEYLEPKKPEYKARIK